MVNTHARKHEQKKQKYIWIYCYKIPIKYIKINYIELCIEMFNILKQLLRSIIDLKISTTTDSHSYRSRNCFGLVPISF